MTGPKISSTNASSRLRLGVNIDHVATIRNARGGSRPIRCAPRCSPSQAGADGITAHLREDRRHIRDEDMARLQREITVPLNFEMAATRRDDGASPWVSTPRCLPGAREARGAHDRRRARRRRRATITLRPTSAELECRGHPGLACSSRPMPQPIEASLELGAPVVELHAGAWCEAEEHGDHARPRASSSVLSPPPSARHRSASRSMPAMASISKPQSGFPP